MKMRLSPAKRPNRRATLAGCLGFEYFQAGNTFSVGDIAVSSFTIPHDAADPVGFVFEVEGIRVGLATDLGYVPPNVQQRLRGCDVLMIESNHDLEMLRDGPYPWSVKQRVMSRVGHLSNDAAAGFLEKNYDGKRLTSFWRIFLRVTTFRSWRGSRPRGHCGSG